MIRFLFLLFLSASIEAEEFTLCSYNCGGLSGYYDYYRAAVSEKIMQERYREEPEVMALNEKIQTLALKAFYSNDPKAIQKWKKEGYDQALKQMAALPSDPTSPNLPWYQKNSALITPWNVRPIVISDEEIRHDFLSHLLDVTRRKEGTIDSLLPQAFARIAARIFAHELKFDIICLQETEFLSPDLFPSHFDALFDSSMGIAWNKERFEFVKTIGSIPKKGFVILLKDKKSHQEIAVASGHLTGSNPYEISKNPITDEPDSQKGDEELKEIVELLEKEPALIKVIGMDSNIAATHPRLQIIQKAGYVLDDENFLYPTCTNPYTVLNLRIDWIAAHSNKPLTVINIPVLNVSLNNIRTNMSDHRPIAARIMIE